MTNSDVTSSNSPKENHVGTGNSQHTHEASSPSEETLLDGELNKILDQAQDWIKENQTVAMLGGFGLGVFIGVLLRR